MGGTGAALVMDELEAWRSTKIGSLTDFRSGVDGSLVVVLDDPTQLSKRLESRFCDIELRHPDAVEKLWIDDVESGEEERGIGETKSFCFAVPSPSSDSSSDSSRRARRRRVASEGSSELVELVRDLERRYHSSGTEKRKVRVADLLNGLVTDGVSRILETIALGESLDDSFGRRQ